MQPMRNEFGDRELAGIDHIAAVLQRIIEALEDELGIGRHVEGDDDRRLQAVGQQGAEAHGAHAVDQHPGILPIALAAAGDAALGRMLLDRLAQRHDDVDGRREAVLAGAGEGLGLVEQVEHQRRGVALALGQRLVAADHEAQARHAFQALVGGSGQRVVADLARIDLERAEGAHGIDQQAAAVARDDLRHLGDGIEDARRGLAVDGEDVADRLVVAEHPVEPRQVGRRVLRRFERCRGAAGDLGDLERALAVGAVDQHQQLAALRHEARDHRLDGEGAGALHRDRRRACPARPPARRSCRAPCG